MQTQIERYISVSLLYLFDDWPSVFPLMEAVTGQRIDTLHLAQLPVSQRFVQKVLQSQLLVFIIYIMPHVHLGEGGKGREGGEKNHTTGD